jgi:hypothetical protein
MTAQTAEHRAGRDTRLNQLIAVMKGVKSAADRTFTDLHRITDKGVPLSGISKTYEPKDAEGDALPAESTLVQVRTEDVIADAVAALTRLFDVTGALDSTNTVARADVVLPAWADSSRKVVVRDVPVTTLLFLEKQVIGLHTFVAELPVLDPAFAWSYDDARNCYATPPVLSTRTRKVPKAFELAPATDKHPAQVEKVHEDVLEGTWTTVRYSGAMPAKRKAVLLARVAALAEAVKFAREAANMTPVVDVDLGGPIFGYLFGE